MADRTYPDKEAFKNLVAIISTEETAAYANSQFKKLESAYKKVGMLDVFKEYSNILNTFEQNIRLEKGGRANVWLKPKVNVLSDFENFQQSLAQNAAKMVTSQVNGPINTDYAANEKANFLRVFVAEGAPVSPEVERAMDTLNSAILASKKMKIENATIYKIDTETGHILKNNKNEPVLASVEDIQQAMNELPDYLKQFGIEGTVRQRNYPGAAPQQVKKVAVVPEEKTVPAKTPEPVSEQVPSTGVGPT